MHKYYIPHELKEGDITHLSDNDSEIGVKNGLKVEDIIEVETYSAIFNAIVTDVASRSIEVEILKKIGERTNDSSKQIGSLNIIQSALNNKKFNFIVEKCVEVGVSSIIPVITTNTLVKEKEFNRNRKQYLETIEDATEQSRNPYPTILKELINLKDIANLRNEGVLKLCLCTEVVKTKGLKELILSKDIKGLDIYVAIGPESGWSASDLEILKKSNFEFVQLKGNILRTETSALVVSSILKFVRGEL